MFQELKGIIIKSILVLIILTTSIFFQDYKVYFYVLSYFIMSYNLLFELISDIKEFDLFNEVFLMLLASIGTIFLKDYTESIVMMFLYQIGEILQNWTFDKSKKSISSLIEIQEKYVNVENDDGSVKKVDPSTISIGDILVVKNGEKILLDGVVIEGNSNLDMSNLTGESKPILIRVGDNILSGSINTLNPLKIQVLKVYSDSTLHKILDIIENAPSKKSMSEKFITKFSKIYTPIIVFFSLLILFLSYILKKNWYYKAIFFLATSCPCPLIISIPLAFFAGLGFASKNGILFKGTIFLEKLSKIKLITFDKTGTLTYGIFKLVSINSILVKKDKLLELVSYAEYYSNHPIATSIKKEYKKVIETKYINDFQEIQGLGVKAIIKNKEIIVGNKKLMKSIGIIPEDNEEIGTIIYVAIDKKYAGYLIIKDEIRKNSKKLIKELNELKIDKMILTGDKKEISNNVGKEVGINKIYSELLPLDKVDKIEELKQLYNENIAFVGDGMNDAPTIVKSPIGIAMGGIGSDISIESADMIITDDNLLKIPLSIKIAKKTMKIIKENIIISLLTKIIVMLLNIINYFPIWLAIFSDVGICIIVILNSIKIYKSKLNKC